MIDPEIESLFATPPPLFAQFMALQGEVYRELENRRTQRIILNHQPYFIKQHFGVGWREIFKNLMQLRLPIVSAKTEWQALKHLNTLNIPVPLVKAYGYCGLNPARRQSFLLTRELPPNISLEDLCKTWHTEPPAFRFKQQLIKEVARIARIMHDSGMNHRDFYLCHFLLDLKKNTMFPLLYLIDLHRAQIRQQVSTRWRIKDLAGLYFSSKDIGLTQRDKLRFIREYRKKSLSFVLTRETAFWLRVKKRGDKLYQHYAR